MRDDSVYLLNNVKHIMQSRPNEDVVDDDNKKDEIVEILINGNMNKLPVNVRKCELSLKQWLRGTSKSFQNKNMIMSGLNMENYS